MPKHEWPFYMCTDNGWYQTNIEPVSNIVEVASYDFSDGLIEETVDVRVSFAKEGSRAANGLRIFGVACLCEGVELRATNAFNGDKVFSLDPIEPQPEIMLALRYRLGGGLGSLQIEQL